MIGGIVGVLLLGLLWTGVAMLYDKALGHGARPLALYFAAGLLLGPLAWLLTPNWPALREVSMDELWPLAALMLAGGALNVGVQVLLLHTLRAGPRGVVWAMAQSALVVPLIAASVFFLEPMSALKLGGVLVLLAGVICLATMDYSPIQPQASRLWKPMALLTFLGIGLVHSVNLVPSHLALFHDIGSLRVPFFMTGYMLTVCIVGLSRKLRPTKPEWMFGAGYALLATVSAVVMYACMDRMAVSGLSGVVIPMATGISIAGFALLRTIRSGDSCGTLQFIGFAVLLCGLVLLGLAAVFLP